MYLAGRQHQVIAVGVGANNLDYLSAISIDSSGNLYLAGSTTGALAEVNAGLYDAFVAKILPTGNLDTSFNSIGIKQIGNVTVGSAANGYELAVAIRLDSSGNIYWWSDYQFSR